jgi:hypothetical protein|uniref:Uncharacterized protein n=2 Tax=Picea TaxID=3328 RepID=A0A101M5J5_PICGL|nr:hypothetical protein ABT39_MTgene1071 [Picea glauca]QHR90002.1 hypothetical protein Q903MT_gene4025 [Picea sitchensis]
MPCHKEVHLSSIQQVFKHGMKVSPGSVAGDHIEASGALPSLRGLSKGPVYYPLYTLKQSARERKFECINNEFKLNNFISRSRKKRKEPSE